MSNIQLSSEEKRKLLAQLLKEKTNKPRTFPLSSTQQRLWFLNQFDPDSPAYNISFATHLTGRLDVDILKQSLNSIVDRHEMLRTTFTTINHQQAQVIAPTLILPLTQIDLQFLSKAEQDAEIQRLLQKKTQHPFDLAKGPLLQATLIKLDEKEHILLVVVHHIVFDGWSKGLFNRELCSWYTAFATGRSPNLTELPIQYADYAQWQHNWLRGKVLETQLAYWKQQLAGAPAVLELPTDRPRPPFQTFQGASEQFEIESDVIDTLKKIGHGLGTTLFMSLLSAFAALLYRYSNQEDIVIGSPMANRNRKETEALIGFFANTLALRIDLSGNLTFLELLSRVRKMALGAYTHQDTPFEKLVEELQPERSLSHSPLFQVMFVLQNTPHQEAELPGLTITPLELETEAAKFDLVLQITEETKGKLEYNTDLFDKATITRMIGHWQTLLAGIVAYPENRISELPLLTKAEQQQLLVTWNHTAIDYPRTCVHHLFEAQVEKTPNGTAGEFNGQTLTYLELNLQANQLAHYLQGLGVGPEVLVGICVERSLKMIVGLLGILKAGGAYLPLDPSYPQERLDFMIADAQVSILLTQEKLSSGLSHSKRQVICLDSDWETIAQQPASNIVNGVTPQNLAYVIYTSGSTGKPKGTLIFHQGLINYLSWSTKAYAVADGDGAPVQSSIGFDATITSLFTPLLVGKKVVFLSEEDELEALVDTLYGQNKYSLIKITPAHLEILSELLPNPNKPEPEKVSLQKSLPNAQEFYGLGPNPNKPEPEKGSLQKSLPNAQEFYGLGPKRQNIQTKMFVIGGEALFGNSLSFWRNQTPEIRIINEYGPTETVVGCCTYEVSSQSPLSDIVPIGRPIANTQLFLLDQYHQPVPIGIPGELYIGGDGLARGYLNRPGLTAEKFIPNPFGQKIGSRLYKTGDLARLQPDGNFEFLGRVDRQVKIRSFRIELAEIESVLLDHPGVSKAVATVREDTPGNKRLVAYFVTTPEAETGVNQLRLFLKDKLPEYMIPSTFVEIDSLSLTSNGKVDYRALPMPDVERPEQEQTYVAPSNVVENSLANIWSDVLGINSIGTNDNFFELGGHSLQIVQLVSKISAAMNQNISIRDVFLCPTIAGLAGVLNSKKLNGALNSNEVRPHIKRSISPSSEPSPSISPFLKFEYRPLLSLFATEKIKPVDAAALGYMNRKHFTQTEPVYQWFDNLPVCARLMETSLGRTALILLPRFDTELYVDEKSLVEVIVDALRMAKHIGARNVSLTGLIPSATNYGQAVKSAIADQPSLPTITTGHGTTTAAVVLNIKRILQESHRDIKKECVGFLGLGSIGVASLRLMLKCLPHPPEIILCDIYSKRNALEEIKHEIIANFGFQGTVRLMQSQADTSAEFYESTLIVGATNAPDILDINQLNPGTIMVDDSAPHCFNIKQAFQRFETQQDILFTEGGVLKSSQPIKEIRYIPNEATQTKNLSELEASLARGYKHHPHTITGCIFSGLLSAVFEDFKPTVGLIDVETSTQHYDKLTELGFQGADLHCRRYALDPNIIQNFQDRFGG